MQAELKKRIVTGVFGAAALLSLLTWGGSWGTALFCAGISLGMLLEWSAMTFKLSDSTEKKWVLLGSAWIAAFFNFWIPRAEYELLILFFLVLFVYFMATAPRHQLEGQGDSGFLQHLRELLASYFGLLYAGFLPFYLILIRQSSNGLKWVFIFLFLNWAGDSAAYFIGKRWGKTKLYPAISPKKTVEGGLAGIAAGWIVTFVFKVLFFKDLGWFAVFVMPIVIGIVSQVGDFCESFVKRAFQVKDSGSVLPGHGGLLDRFDGVLFSLPVMYACTRFF